MKQKTFFGVGSLIAIVLLLITIPSCKKNEKRVSETFKNDVFFSEAKPITPSDGEDKAYFRSYLPVKIYLFIGYHH